MPDNLPQQVDVQLPPETSSVVVAKVVYGLHALSIIIGVVTARFWALFFSAGPRSWRSFSTT